MSDLIERQALLEALLSEEYDERQYCFPCKKVLDTIEAVPSVIPKQKPDSNTLDALDCISRQAAIYAIDAICSPESCKSFLDKSSNDCEVCQVDACMKALDALPSAQPELATNLQLSSNYLSTAQPEIIHCKDCIHFNRWCMLVDPCGEDFTADDYCSKAERRSDETD